MLPKHVTKVIEDLKGLVDDNIDQALENEPSPERAKALIEACVDFSAFERIERLAQNYPSIFRR